MMLTNSKRDNLTHKLIDCREKLLWLIDQDSTTDEQRICIEKGKEKLKQVNKFLKGFDYEFPN